MNERLTFGSLFAGIGGIDLGLERAGWTCRWQVEWDEYCQHVLAHHWPDVPRYGDITAVDWSSVEPVDLIAGGFPCQPVSIAGRGRAQSDDRWLWPEFARAIRYLRPRYVLVENVRNLLAVNDGAAFGEVLGDLAALGYDAEWDCIPAAAVGAPHVRDRVWIVGTRAKLGRLLADPDDGRPRDSVRTGRDAAGDGCSDVADAISGFESLDWAAGRMGRLVELDPTTPDRRSTWTPEPDVGRVVDGVPARMDRLRALGNAVVPQVVEMIGQRLAELA